MQKSIIISEDAISQVNSTNYTDVLGVQTGLDRFPGETAADYLNRLQRAIAQNLSPTSEGFLNQLNLHLGLEPVELLTISDESGLFAVDVNLSGLTLTSAAETVSIPLRTVDADSFWQWRKASAITADINASRSFQALQTGEDVPAVTLVAQSNLRQVKSIPFSGNSFAFPQTGVVAETVVFNIAVPPFVFSDGNRGLLFDKRVQPGTEVTYAYRVCPYRVVAYPAAVLSLSDPQLEDVALADGKMIYQVREYLYKVTDKDRSYWGK